MDDDRTDAALLSATAGGDAAAFAILVRRHIRLATLLAMQVLRNREDAEDVVQEAFAIVYQKVNRFDAERPFPPWLFAIVRRLAGNRRSRDLRRARLLQFWGWATGRSEPASSRSEEALADGLDAAKAKRAMKMLSPMQRACFELVAVHGLSGKEVAAMHGISESTVRQHVYRARLALLNALDGNHAGSADA